MKRIILSAAIVMAVAFTTSDGKAEAASGHWLLGAYFSPANIVRTPYAVVSTGNAFASWNHCAAEISRLLEASQTGSRADVRAGRYVKYACIYRPGASYSF